MSTDELSLSGCRWKSCFICFAMEELSHNAGRFRRHAPVSMDLRGQATRVFALFELTVHVVRCTVKRESVRIYWIGYVDT